MDNIIIKKINNIKYLQFPILLNYGINHGFYIGKELNFRTFNHEGAHPENFKNYKTFLDVLGLDYRKLAKPNQSHTDNILVINDKVLNDAPDLNVPKYDDIDALITNNPNIILGTTAADCMLVYIYDPIKKVIANVHSGWKGTLKNITIKTIHKMIEEFSSSPSDLIVCINPAIRKDHFEVGEEVYLDFKDKFPDEKYYEFRNSKWFIDLQAILIDELLKIKVQKENIIDAGICTFCDKEMHSYRRDKEKFGLALSVISLKEEKC